jgi:hypothetical protein
MIPDPRARQKWIAMLAKLCSPIDPATAGAALAAMLPMLNDFPDEAFSMGSLAAVAEKAKRVPSYAELRAHLAEWWKDNRPPPKLAIADNVTSLKPEDRGWLAYWHKRQAEGFEPLREADGRLARPGITDWKAHTADLIRFMSPDAWAQITRGDA